MSVRAILSAVVVAAIWGLNFSAIHAALQDFPPMFLGALRFVAAIFPVIFLVGLPSSPWKSWVFFGLAIGVFKFGALFVAMRHGMPAGVSSIVLQSQAFFTVLLASVLLRDIPRSNQILGMIVAGMGVALVLAGSKLGAGAWPFFLVLFAALCWAVANIVVKRAAPKDAINFVVWASTVPVIPMFLASWVFEGPELMRSSLSHARVLSVVSVLYIGWISTVLAFGIWGSLLRTYSPSKVAPFSLLVPFFGVGFAHLLFGESLTFGQTAGAALVILGLVLNSVSRRRENETTSLPSGCIHPKTI